jgi:hypothetical protein
MRDNLLVILFFGTVQLIFKSLTLIDLQIIIAILLALVILYTHLLKVLYVTHFLYLWFSGKETLKNLPAYIKAVEGKNEDDK